MIFVNMVIADQDEVYLSRLAKWFRENRSNQFQIMAFTEKESLLRFMKETDLNIDVLLIGENFLSPELSAALDIIILGQPIEPVNNGFKYIDKYLPAPSLCSEVLSAISDSENPIPGKAGKSELIICFSPEPRLKSTLALYLSGISNDNIYINLEPFPFYMTCQNAYKNQKNLSDVLYHIKASKGNVIMALESAVLSSYNGINIIPPMDNPKDLWELSDKETGILIDSLKSWGHFKNIIADLEFSVGPHINQWLESSSLILIPFEIKQLNQIRRLKNMLNLSIPEEKIKWILADECGYVDLPEDFSNILILEELKAFSGEGTNINPNPETAQVLSGFLKLSSK
ncbi:MAG: hypothetical protein PHC69_00815 [Ruminiclostridium sp.]|nr:hypothetical protein [Ruminiclostridium sp.]